ncbi:MAG: hypothetical protein AAF799_13095 [Myxococcota bacterium]
MMADLELRALLDGVVETVDAELGADPGYRDFAAVIARAHELDPSRISAETVAEVNHWAPVVSIKHAHRRRQTREDVELLAVIEGVRAEVEQDVAQSLGTPPPVAFEPPHREPAARRIWAAVFAAAAVLLLIGWGVIESGRGRLLSGDPSRSEAAHVVPTRVPSPSVDAAVPGAEVQTPAPAAVVEPEVEPAPVGETEAAAAVAPLDDAPAEPARRRARRPRAQPEPRASTRTLEELDAMAHAAWRAGDLSKAERLFRILTKRAGKGRLGDLAYGDLFTLARQRKARGTETALWREYLERFPHGRFADDARAGLCRRASGDAQRQCWQRYLETMPDGTHRARAKAALDRDDEGQAP